MRRFTHLARMIVAIIAVVFVVGLVGCASAEERAIEVVTPLLESYVIPTPDEDGVISKDAQAAWDNADFGDGWTMHILTGYGVDADEWHRHCFANYSFEVGEAVSDKDKGTVVVSVTITNESLEAAVEAAAADFAEFATTNDYQNTYAEGGHQELFKRLVAYVYARLDANADPVTTTLLLTVEKIDDEWTIDISDNAAFFLAIYGGSNVVSGLGVDIEL